MHAARAAAVRVEWVRRLIAARRAVRTYLAVAGHHADIVPYLYSALCVSVWRTTEGPGALL